MLMSVQLLSVCASRLPLSAEEVVSKPPPQALEENTLGFFKSTFSALTAGDLGKPLTHLYLCLLISKMDIILSVQEACWKDQVSREVEEFRMEPGAR